MLIWWKAAGNLLALAPPGISDGPCLPYMLICNFHTQVFRWANAMSQLQSSGRCRERCHDPGCAACPPSAPTCRSTLLALYTRHSLVAKLPSQHGTRENKPARHSISMHRQHNIVFISFSSHGVVSCCLGPTRWVEVPGTQKYVFNDGMGQCVSWGWGTWSHVAWKQYGVHSLKAPFPVLHADLKHWNRNSCIFPLFFSYFFYFPTLLF